MLPAKTKYFQSIKFIKIFCKKISTIHTGAHIQCFGSAGQLEFEIRNFNLKTYYVCVCVNVCMIACVRFNSSEITGHRNIKPGTIN